MEISEREVRALVERLVAQLRRDETSAAQPQAASQQAPAAASQGGGPSAERATPAAARRASAALAGVFESPGAAVEAARVAFAQLGKRTLETRRAIVSAMREAALANLKEFAVRAVEETGMGRVEDKIRKNRIAAELTPGVEDLKPVCFTDDHGLTLVERAPYGVICSVTPCTNPTETIVNNAIGMVAAGNAVVFNPHPAARGVSNYAIDVLNRAIQAAGGPANLLCAVAEPTIESAQELFAHRGVDLLVVTGGGGVVRAAMSSGKRVVAGGPGNPPVVVDETADLVKAGRDIASGASFDNNIICVDEKEILAVASIADRLKAELVKNGAYELSRGETERVTQLVIAEPGGPGREGAPNKAFVGKDAAVIARAAGITVPEATRILLCEVEREHPLVWTEQLLPVIPLVRVADADEAIALARECEHGFRHTAVMHSLNIERLSKMAKVMDCSLFVKNGSAYNGLGFGGAGFTSWTIATPTGDGLTRATTFSRERRCALIDYFRIV